MSATPPDQYYALFDGLLSNAHMTEADSSPVGRIAMRRMVRQSHSAQYIAPYDTW